MDDNHISPKLNEDITYFGRVGWRSDRRLFGIKQADRLMHMYMIGKTGTGKSSLIQTMIMQDIQSGRGCCLLDPHGDLVGSIATAIPESRKSDLIYFNFPNSNLNLKYNPFKRVTYEKRSLVASGILEVFSKLWDSAWGVKLEHILRHAILTLLDQPTATVADIPEILLNKDFRQECLKNVRSESVRKFWKREFPEYHKYDLLPVMNKIGGMLAHPVIRRALIENTEEISLRKAMDDKKIVLVNLSKGHIGEDASHLLGALFITSIASAAFSRADIDEAKRIPFMVYMDEFHNFTTLSLVNMFSELRKFKTGMILAHQYLDQLDEKIKRAVLGNAGTIISFRIGTEDAMFMSREMYPEFDIEDLINLANYRIYLKLMIDGKPSRPFSSSTLCYFDSSVNNIRRYESGCNYF